MKPIALRPLLPSGTPVGDLTTGALALDNGGERLYRARTRDGRSVIIEVLDWPDGERAIRATRRAQPLVDAPPSGCLRLLAVGEQGRRSWRILAPFDGGPIDATGPASPEVDRLAIARAVTAALIGLHDARRVHGDLRLASVVHDRSSTARALIFGAERLPGARIGLGADRVGPSPEQARGEAPTPASDLHALGIMLHGLCTGLDPFPPRSIDGPDLRTALVVTTAPPMPRSAVVEPRFGALIKRLMSKAPADRPTALEAMRAIERIGSGAAPAGGRRARMVARATQPLPSLDGGEAPIIAVLGALPLAVHDRIVAAGFSLRPAASATGAAVLVALGVAPDGLGPLIDRWPAVVADVDPDDIGGMTALARLGLAGVLVRPLEPAQAVRCITRAMRAALRRR